MPIGIVNDNEWNSELGIIDGAIIKGQIVEKAQPGRAPGDNNIPEILRNIIGDAGANDSRAEALGIAQSFNISPSSVSAYTNGANSTSSYHTPSSVLSHINKRKVITTRRAQRKLLDALDHITEDKLVEAKVGDLATVARAMSAIVKDMEPESVRDNTIPDNKPQIVIYAPRIAQESYFGEPILVND